MIQSPLRTETGLRASGQELLHIRLRQRHGAAQLNRHEAHLREVLHELHPQIGQLRVGTAGQHAVPAQQLAYFTAIAKGTDVDQPRNLAKSVTVE